MSRRVRLHPPSRLKVTAAAGWLLAMTLPGVAVDYEKEIRPLLKERCYSCHGALKQKGGLRLDTVAAMRRGGDGGDVLAGSQALLLERLTSADKDDRMPPEGEGSTLNEEQVAKIRAWITEGGHAPGNDQAEPDPRSHWAYQIPRSSGRTPDALLADRLASRKLRPQPRAAPETWLRRVCLDLTGLPPTVEQVRDFLKDSSPVARRRVVDHLLASPQYGERWARHFMDIWRYCDWYGLGDQLRHSQKHLWHWRDWIVESLNADKGYDRMIVQMLAADELAPEDRDNLRATGFLARSYYLFNRTTWLDETIEHTCRAFLGLTMQCVKCHDHKYDPVDQPEYYRMRAIFEPMHVRLDPWPGEPDLAKNGLPRVFDLHLDKPTFRHVRGDEKNEDKSRPLPPGIPAVLEFAAFQPAAVKLPAGSARPLLLPFVMADQAAAAERAIATAQKGLEEANKVPVGMPGGASASRAAVVAAEKRLAEARARLPLIRAVSAAEQKRSDKGLAAEAANLEARWQLARAEAELAKAEAEPAAKDASKKVRAAREAVNKARKQMQSPGEKYTLPQVSLKAQEGPEETGHAAMQAYPETSTGRRLALARWIADRRNPLTARVLVNQVWMRHFGTPLVFNVDDFGLRSPAPLHQDVLDTLAADFMEQGWSLKELHRVMVLSELYQRSSSNAQADPATLAADPDNLGYWRMNPRRMESQVVRDSLLMLSGRLDLHLGGPGLDPAKAETSPRRSLYFIQNADVEHRFLATFDNSNVLECYRRNESVVPQQALALTNSRLGRECAEALAGKMAALKEEDFIGQAFLAVLNRAPDDRERAVMRDSFQMLKGDRVLLLQALLSHNDFVTLR